MVKCSECGFLAVRNTESHELEEADETFREKGIIPLTGHAEGRPRSRHEPLPLCFARCHDLQEEFKNVPGEDKAVPGGVHRVIIKERQCDAFTEWQQGFTPKEHREMIDRRWERKWRIITGLIFAAVAGAFTLLGVFIANLN